MMTTSTPNMFTEGNAHSIDLIGQMAELEVSQQRKLEFFLLISIQ